MSLRKMVLPDEGYRGFLVAAGSSIALSISFA
jgi:hypothetical protein